MNRARLRIMQNGPTSPWGVSVGSRKHHPLYARLRRRDETHAGGSATDSGTLPGHGWVSPWEKLPWSLTIQSPLMKKLGMGVSHVGMLSYDPGLKWVTPWAILTTL